MNRYILHFIFLYLIHGVGMAQQVQDTGFDPDFHTYAYPKGKGPVILVDEAHHNFHTLSTRYLAFGKILTKDGYVLKPNKQPFSAKGLKDARILVIANALHASDTLEWILPNPSAFTKAEIAAVVTWVKGGGSLFFIADHMPCPGAGEDLAKAFGFTFYNGFAFDTTDGLVPGKKKELDVFRKSSGTLAQHPITKGVSKEENVDSVATFTGQGFQIPAQATSLLTFNDRYKILLTDTAWKFSTRTKRLPIGGFSQGAVTEFGKGRVAIFGEAATFTAQLKGKDKIPFGINSKDAPQNLQFLLNVIHWLDRKI